MGHVRLIKGLRLQLDRALRFGQPFASAKTTIDSGLHNAENRYLVVVFPKPLFKVPIDECRHILVVCGRRKHLGFDFDPVCRDEGHHDDLERHRLLVVELRLFERNSLAGDVAFDLTLGVTFFIEMGVRQRRATTES
jgi:hypothetical protein